MGASFAIAIPELKEIHKIYKKKDYTSDGIKGHLANDFFVRVKDGTATFIEVDENMFCYSEIKVTLPEKLEKKYTDHFKNGLMPFDLLEAFDKLVVLIGSAEVAVFEYDEERVSIDITTFGNITKELKYATRSLEHNKSYNLFERASNFYNITIPIPTGHKKDEESGKPVDKFDMSSHIRAKSAKIAQPVKDSRYFDTRTYTISAQSAEEIVIEAKNSGKTGLNSMRYTIPVKIKNFTPVDRSVGFGFTHFLDNMSGTINLFYYNEEAEYSSCVLRNSSENLTINALLNFTILDEFADEDSGDEDFEGEEKPFSPDLPSADVSDLEDNEDDESDEEFD